MAWNSYHFYPLEVPDVFLARSLRPFLERHVWPQKGARAFFLRYDDEKGPHIRLRFKGEQEWLDNSLQPVFEEWFRERGKWESQPYLPEADRFGGEEALSLAEEHFHISSRVVLDRLNRPYSYGDAILSHVLTAAQILEFQQVIRKMPVADNVLEYAVGLTAKTRPGSARATKEANNYLSWGAGPRASQYLALGAKCHAALRGKYSPDIEDVQAIANLVLRHRIVRNYKAEAEGVTEDNIIEAML